STTLTQVCDVHAADRTIHFLKIDVEGWEDRVLTGMDFARYRPIVVVVEATRPTTQEETHTTWQSCLLSNGYRDAYFDGLNRFFLREDRTDLEACFRTPPNCFDHFQLHAVTSRDEVNASLNSVIASLQARVIAQEATIVKQEATIVGQEAT